MNGENRLLVTDELVELIWRTIGSSPIIESSTLMFVIWISEVAYIRIQSSCFIKPNYKYIYIYKILF